MLSLKCKQTHVSQFCFDSLNTKNHREWAFQLWFEPDASLILFFCKQSCQFVELVLFLPDFTLLLWDTSEMLRGMNKSISWHPKIPDEICSSKAHHVAILLFLNSTNLNFLIQKQQLLLPKKTLKIDNISPHSFTADKFISTTLLSFSFANRAQYRMFKTNTNIWIY